MTNSSNVIGCADMRPYLPRYLGNLDLYLDLYWQLAPQTFGTSAGPFRQANRRHGIFYGVFKVCKVCKRHQRHQRQSLEIVTYIQYHESHLAD